MTRRLLNQTDLDTLAWTRTQCDNIGNYNIQTGVRLSTWLVIGNAGALALIYQSGPDAIINVGNQYISAYLFAFGLLAAFAGIFSGWYVTFLSYQQTLLSVHHLSNIASATEHLERSIEFELKDIDQQARNFEETLRNSEVALEAINAKLQRRMPLVLIPLAIQAISALLFMGGVGVPLMQGAGLMDRPANQEAVEIGRTIMKTRPPAAQ